MSLKNTNALLMGVAAIFCAVLAAAYAFQSTTLLCVFLGTLVAWLALWLWLWRCPYCKRHLGRDGGAYCRHCGRKIKE